MQTVYLQCRLVRTSSLCRRRLSMRARRRWPLLFAIMFVLIIVLFIRAWRLLCKVKLDSKISRRTSLHVLHEIKFGFSAQLNQIAFKLLYSKDQVGDHLWLSLDLEFLLLVHFFLFALLLVTWFLVCLRLLLLAINCQEFVHFVRNFCAWFTDHVDKVFRDVWGVGDFLCIVRGQLLRKECWSHVYYYIPLTYLTSVWSVL